jgi:DEAD/DEAH box helicase domain-containing protein
MNRILYFDLETKYSADEVGGWGNIEDMGMSIGVIWDTLDEKFHVYIEHQIKEMVDHFYRADQIVGFNHVGFDYRVVAGVHYADSLERSSLHTELAGLKNFDMLLELKKLLGHRLKLESIARPTLGTGKSADGLQALKWYKEGKLDKIIAYCKVDVEVTRDVHLYALENRKLHYDSRSGIKTVSVDWNSQPKKQEPQQMSFF